MSWNDQNMTPAEMAFWREIGKGISKARRSVLSNENKNTKAGTKDRRRVAMTQDDLAELVGLSRPSIANIECGRQRIDLFMYKKIMDQLK